MRIQILFLILNIVSDKSKIKKINIKYELYFKGVSRL